MGFTRFVKPSKRLGIICGAIALTFCFQGFAFAQGNIGTSCTVDSYNDGFPVCRSGNLGIPTITPSLPGVRFAQGAGISPDDAFDYYTEGAGAFKAASQVDFRVKDLARALRYDIDNIYEYVYNSVDFNPSFGLKKGARGAILDGDGTALDQAHLMVDLLRASEFDGGKTYDPKYKIGVAEFTTANGLLQDALSWIGVSHASQLCLTLADNGLPAKVNGTTDCSTLGSAVTKLELLHAWVEASVAGQTYVFDPSFKSYAQTTPIDMSAAMQYGGSTFRAAVFNGSSEATISNNVPTFSKINQTNLNSNLDAFGSNYVTYIQSNLPDKHVDDIFGGRRINMIAWPKKRQLSLPYQKSVKATWNGEVPPSYRTRIVFTVMPATSTLASEGTSIQLFADDFFGRRIFADYYTFLDGATLSDRVRIFFNRGTVEQGRQVSERRWPTQKAADGVEVIPPNLQIFIDHPYAANNGALNDTLSIRGMSRNRINDFIFSTGYVPPNKYRTKQYLRSKQNGTDVGDYFSVAHNQAARLIGNVNRLLMTHHHTFGVVSIPNQAGVADESQSIHDLDTLYSLNSLTGDASTEKASKAVFASILSGMEALGGSDDVYISPAGITLMGSALKQINDTPVRHSLSEAGFTSATIRILEVNSANYQNAKAHIKANLTALSDVNGGPSYRWTTAHNLETLNRIGDYVNAGFTVYVPERPLVYGEHGIRHTGNPDGPASGACFYTLGKYSCAFPLNFLAISSDGNTYANMIGTRKGADASIDEIADAGQYIKDSLPETIASSKQVSLSSGMLSLSQTLLSSGSGSFPESLSYGLTYSLENRYDAFTGRWRSGFEMDYNTATDLAVSFGERGPADAAMALAGIYAATDVLESGSGLKEHMLAQAITSRVVEQVHNGTSVFRFGQNFNAVFAHTPGGALPAPGSNLKWGAEKWDGSTATGVTTIDGVSYAFNGTPHNPILPTYAVSIQYPTGQFAGISWTNIDNPDEERPGVNVKKYTAENSFGRKITVTQVDDRDNFVKPSGFDIEDENGRTAKVQNISGPWTQFVDSAGNKSRMKLVQNYGEYGDDVPALELLLMDANGVLVMRANFDYDGRVKSVTNALGNTEHYYIANGWRGEVVDAQGASRINKYNDRGQLIESVGVERE